MKIKKILFPVLLAAAFCGCKDKDLPFGAVLETNESTVNFGYEGGSQQVIINSNRIFEAMSGADWCGVEILSGQLENLKITVARNENIGWQRSCEITLSSEGLEDKKLTVVQDGIEAVILITEGMIEVKDGNEFSLEIESNILFTFTLPEWVHPAAGNEPAVGKNVYYFTLDALPDGMDYRSDYVLISAADPLVSKSAAVTVSQGEQTGIVEGINKETPYILEAEECVEGLEQKYMEWWATSGTGLGDNYYVNAYNTMVSWVARVIDSGAYDMSLRQMSWGGGSVELFIDGVSAATLSIGDCGGDLDVITFEDVNLEAGMRNIGMLFTGNSDFDKVTVTYAGE